MALLLINMKGMVMPLSKFILTRRQITKFILISFLGAVPTLLDVVDVHMVEFDFQHNCLAFATMATTAKARMNNSPVRQHST